MSDNSFSATLREQIAQAVNNVRTTTPLAQSFTNFVTMNLVANAQLAAGGTAAMSFLPDDVIDTAEIAGSNYINVGTLLPFFKDALPEIAYKLHKNGTTWVLDPVAAGIGKPVPPFSNRSAPIRRPSCAAMRARSSHSMRCGVLHNTIPPFPARVRQAWRLWTRSMQLLTQPNEWLVILPNTPPPVLVRWPFPERSIW